MSEHEQVEPGGRTVAGWSVIVLSVLLGLWIFTTFPLSWTHTDISDAGTTTYTGVCSGPGAVDWSPEQPPDPSGIDQAEAYCSDWSGVVTVVSITVAAAGTILGAWLLSRRPGPGAGADELLGEEAVSV